MSASELMNALALAKAGKVYDLEGVRQADMPLWPGHPAFQVLTYRTPQGVKNKGPKPFPEPNDPKLSLMSDFISGTAHSGTHMDALAHIVRGDDQSWYCGKAETDLGDFGPLKGSASELPLFITRGVFIDAAGKVGHHLRKGEPFGIEEFTQVLEEKNLEIRKGDVVLVRSGAGAYWPDSEMFNQHDGGGITIEVARYLVERGVVAIGGDTSTVEVQPSTVEGNPHPVHEHTLIENAVHLIENMVLEDLAADDVTEFLFIALPIKIAGATASMVRPVAIV